MGGKRDGEKGGDSDAKRHKGGKGERGTGIPATRHALKVLVPDELVRLLLGPRGSSKEDLQRRSGCTLVFSNKDDYFPRSNFRTMGVFGDDPSGILTCCDHIVSRIIDLGEEERRNPPPSGPVYLGKEQNEFIFRLGVSDRMFSSLIGRGGMNIKKMREDTGAKAFLENESVSDHRMMRIIGQPDSIRQCMGIVNDICQQESTNDSFRTWSSYVNFGDVGHGKGSSGGGRDDRRDDTGRGRDDSGRGRDDSGRGGGREDDYRQDTVTQECKDFKTGRCSRGEGCRYLHVKDPSDQADRQECGDFKQGKCTRGNRCRYLHTGDGGGAEARDDSYRHEKRPREESGGGAVTEGVDSLIDAIRSLPNGTANMQYSINFDLPSARIPAMTEVPSFLEYVARTTGAVLNLDETGGLDDAAADAVSCVSIVGPLLAIYAAHLLIKKRIQELIQEEEDAERQRQEDEAAAAAQEERQRQEEERQRQEEEWRPEEEAQEQGATSAQAIQAKIDELQAKLAQAQAMAGSSGGGGGGFAGHGGRSVGRAPEKGKSKGRGKPPKGR